MVRTHKGKSIDMQALKQKNEQKVAIGNTGKNVRGDLLGPGRKVVKTKEQLAAEKYNSGKTKKTATKQALNTPVNEMLGRSKKKPTKFIDQQADKKKLSDKETLGKYDLGEIVKD